MPDAVSFDLRGERGDGVSEEVSVSDEKTAVWEVDEVGVGNWLVTASAAGWEPVSFQFQARGPDDQSDQLDLRLHMRSADRTPPAPDTSGCHCRDREGAGGAPAPGPYAPTALIVVFGLSLAVVRKIRSNS